MSADIASIAGKGFTTIRVYSTDCSTLANVGTAARSNGLKLILGVFISSTGISGAEGQVTDIVSWAQWDLVELVVVGNEAVFNGYCSASALAGFVSSTKGTLSGAGYTGPVSTTEPIETWLSSGSAFCGVVDVVAANLYAFFMSWRLDGLMLVTAMAPPAHLLPTKQLLSIASRMLLVPRSCSSASRMMRGSLLASSMLSSTGVAQMSLLTKRGRRSISIA